MSEYIELEIPKDVRKYEAKLIGPLTTRQTVCAIAIAGLSIGIYFVLDFIPSDIRFFVIAVAATPPALCGWVKRYGMHFEKFIQVAAGTVLSPSVRPYKTENAYASIGEQELKAINKKKNKNKKSTKMKITKKQNPEYIAYT